MNNQKVSASWCLRVLTIACTSGVVAYTRKIRVRCGPTCGLVAQALIGLLEDTVAAVALVAAPGIYTGQVIIGQQL